jgi:uncharacterized protein (TIGR03083 family)
MSDPMPVLAALRGSQDQLARLVSPLSPAELDQPSYDDDWTIADVLSHLGSQAEIFTLFVEAGLSGAAPPSQDAFGPIWDRWNAKSPAAQAADSLERNEALLALIEGLGPERLATFELAMFGMELDAAGLLGIRLGEHALHTWDVEVSLDPAALLPPGATGILIDSVGSLAARAGQPASEPSSVSVRTTDPERRLLLSTGGVSLALAEAPEGSATLELTAEALIRLVYGRLDDGHLGQPAATASGISLAELREVFPGF